MRYRVFLHSFIHRFDLLSTCQRIFSQTKLYLENNLLIKFSFSRVLQAELSGDQAAVQVLEAAEAQVAVELNQELEKLAEKQIEEQAALEVKQVEEMINMEEELRVEQQTAGQQVEDQIDEQKQKVGDELNHFSLNSYFSHCVPYPSPVALH